MGDEFSFQAFAVDVFVKEQELLFGAAGKFMASLTSAFKSRLRRTFVSYMEGLEQRYATSKTIIYRDTPHALKDFYTPLDIKNDETHLSSPDMRDIARLKTPLIITGSGGTGKSTLLKHLMLSAIEQKTHIPIFVELRKLEQPDTTIINEIYRDLKLSKLDLPQDYITSALERGGFALFFDGLDELSDKRFVELSNEIKEIAVRFKENALIVTSRHGYNYESWPTFTELHVSPLTRQKACHLINNLQGVDENLRNRFVKELKGGMFQKHKEFLTNPLLLSMMFLTYKDNADIPNQLHNFYDRVFQALYNRHDVITKEEYIRPTKTGILADQAESIMSAFSVVTYLDRRTSFKEKEAVEYLDKALTLSALDFNSRDLVDDFIRAFCMLLQDGTIYQYAHRSFQEYFAALYFARAPEAQQIKLAPHLAERIGFDNTISIALGLNQTAVEKWIIIPWLESIREKIGYKKGNNKTVMLRFISLFYTAISYADVPQKEEKSIALTLGGDPHEYNFLNFVRDRYTKVEKVEVPSRVHRKLEHFLGGGESISLSKVARMPELSSLMFQYGWFSSEAQEMMDILDQLKARHQKVAGIFDSLLEIE